MRVMLEVETSREQHEALQLFLCDREYASDGEIAAVYAYSDFSRDPARPAFTGRVISAREADAPKAASGLVKASSRVDSAAVGHTPVCTDACDHAHGKHKPKVCFCAHCGRALGVLYATLAGGERVCHSGTGPDCYRRVTVHHEALGVLKKLDMLRQPEGVDSCPLATEA